MALTVLLTWRFRHAVRRSPGDRVTTYVAEPAIGRETQTPIARFSQTSPTSIPTFS
jgi:hypothetical protein